MNQSFLRLEKDYYKPRNRDFNPKIDTRWRVVFPNPTGKGVKKESYKSEADARLRLDELAKLDSSLKSSLWTVTDAIEFWKSRRLYKLKYANKENCKLNLIKKRIGDIRVHELAEGHIVQLKTFLQTGRCIRTVNSYLITLRIVLNYAKRKKAIVSFPDFSEHIDTALEVRRERVVTPDEFERLIAACKLKNGGNRDRMHLVPYLIWLHETGMRTGELAKVERKDIDLKNGVVRIWSGKSKRAVQRECGITPRLRALIEKTNYEDGLIFPQGSWKKAFRTACRLAEIKDLRLHDFRRTAITNFLEKGVPLQLVGKMVGHSGASVLTLDVYTKFRHSFIREQMRKLR